MTRKIAEGGFFREFMSIEVIGDPEQIEYLSKVIGEKPAGGGEAAGDVYEADEGTMYSADFSTSKSQIWELIVSEDEETAVLYKIDC